jgi:hypothetical protein
MRLHAMRRVLRRTIRLLPRRVFVLLVAMSVLVPAAAGGTPYVWCAQMNRARLDCCCHARDGAFAKHEPKRDGRDVIEAACCVGHRVSALPTAPGAWLATAPIAPPPVVAWLTLDELFPRDDSFAVIARRHVSVDARAGPEPPIYALDCTYRN